MLSSKRPAAVADAISAKWLLVTGASSADAPGAPPGDEPMRWANVGVRETETVLVGRDGRSFDSDALVSSVAADRDDGNKGCGGAVCTLLDLGAAAGALLCRAHSAHGVPWSELVGVSAVDERPASRGGVVAGKGADADAASRVPDGSYVTGVNIDTLQEELEARPSLLPQARLVWSSRTLYHCVDPVAALQCVHIRLASPPASEAGVKAGDGGGGTDGGASAPVLRRASVAVLTHVPLRACCPGVSLEGLNAFWEAAGVAAAAAETPDNPDCCVVVLAKPAAAAGGHQALLLPFEYTGEIRRAATGSDRGYVYAAVRWTGPKADAAGGGGSGGVGRDPADAVALLLERHLGVRLVSAASTAPPPPPPLGGAERKRRSRSCALM